MSDVIVLKLKARLSKLPPRAAVAFAVRCARRFEPLIIRDFDLWGVEELRVAIWDIDTALTRLEDWCKGVGDIGTIVTAVMALGSSANRIKSNAFSISAAIVETFIVASTATAAANRAVVVGNYSSISGVYAEAAVEAAASYESGPLSSFKSENNAAISRDIVLLSRVVSETSDGLGTFIDPSDVGPIGPLWGDSPPQWYPESRQAFDQFLGRAASSNQASDRIRW